MRLKWKLLIAFLIALAAWYFGWWIIILPLAVFLYGAAGSVWEKVAYIPQDGDQGVTYYYNQDGESYRNSKVRHTRWLREGGTPGLVIPTGREASDED